MKEKLYALFLFLLVAVSGKGQDFTTESESQNPITGKNIMVDYATGILHYTVPLYQLKSGNYNLPILLDYISKGVRVNEPHGMVGYNWSLNIGGIVTRTMRGGFADETSGFGYLWPRSTTTPLDQDAKNVSLRERDGESDIFTAVFNGKKVDFIIQTDENRHIYALPLEQTDVRIESEGTFTDITGWIITDNNGDRYIYRQRGKCMDVQYVNVSTSNGISFYDYTSEWHLTRILPYNGAPIDFHYDTDVMPLSIHDVDKLPWSRITTMFEEYKMIYHYGNPVKEQPFDFEKYRDKFYEVIGLAQRYLDKSSLKMRFENTQSKIRNFVQYGQINIQPLLSSNIKTNNRIVGILSNISEMASASEKVEKDLRNLSSYCMYQSDYNIHSAGSFMREAADYIHACLSEVRSIRTKEIWGGSSYKIVSPLPTMIVFPEHVVKFTYHSGSLYLSTISLYNRNMEPVSSISLIKAISEVSFLDKDGKKTSNMKFNYYEKSDFPIWKEKEDDFWGYPSAKREKDEEYDECEECKIYTALGSLKNIVLSDGGKIEIGYERNNANDLTVGGVRLKSLIFSDKLNERNDTISYDYPKTGISVYKFYSNITNIKYSGFRDQIEYNRVQQEGHPIINTGNNGFYYPHVTETTSGKGTTVYNYQVVSPSSTINYPYWKNGLLTEKSIYDTHGKLLKKIQYTYETYANSKDKLPQMQPSNFYLDEKKLESFYGNQKSPYLTGKEIYEWNIKPRLSPMNTDKFYILQYNWKIILKEEVEYRSDENCPYRQTKYCYDNSASMYPTCIIYTGSDGIDRTKVLKRVMDMANSADSVFAQMKEANLLFPIVKSLTLISGKLVGETVYRYRADKESKMGSIAPVEVLTYIPDTAKVYIPTAVDTLLFTHGESNYKTETSYQYTNLETSRMQVVTKGRIEQKGHAYDDYGKLILECDVTEITANDQSKGERKLDMEDFDDVLGELYYSLQSYQSALERCKYEVPDFQFADFLWSRTNNRAIAFAKEILKKIPDLNKAKGYYQIIVANNYMEFNTFRDENERYIGLYPIYKDAIDFVKIMETIVHFDEQQLFDYLQSRSEGKKPTWSSDYSLKLTPTPDTRNLQLYILKGIKPVSGEITHSGGNTPFAIESTSTSNLKIVNIDLSKYMDIVSVKVNYHKGCYMALVPEGAIFKATSYNADGTVYARFDQTGNVEYYIYDASGRVIQVKDQHGNLLKTYEYNQLQN